MMRDLLQQRLDPRDVRIPRQRLGPPPRHAGEGVVLRSQGPVEGPPERVQVLGIVDHEDLEALGRALDRALGPEHDALAGTARRRAEALPWDAHVARVESLLHEVAHGV